MATDFTARMENTNLNKVESPSDDSLDSMLLFTNYEGPNFELIDFELLLDNPTDNVRKTSDWALGHEESELNCGSSKKRKQSPKKNASFLDLLDDIFVHDKSMEMVNSPLDRIEELLHSRLAGSPDKKRRKTTVEDECFPMPKTYGCLYCPKKFYSSLLCHNHQVCHAKVHLKCKWCGHRSRSNSGIKRHIQYFHRYSSMCQVFFDSR